MLCIGVGKEVGKVLVYRARLPEDAERVVSVSVRTGRSAAGLGGGRLRTPCRVMIRYAAADGQVRRHRGELLAALAPGVGLQVLACQFAGGEVLLSLRPVHRQGGRAPGLGLGAGAGDGAGPGAGAAGGLAGPMGPAVADSFALPFGLQAWGVTAVTGARVWLRVACRARPGALALRGTLRLALATPGGPLHLRIPFLRVFAVTALPDGLRWRALWRVTRLHAQVDQGGLISGEVLLAVRCLGRPPAGSAALATAPKPDMKSIREVTGQITGLTAEPAGPGCAIIRGTVDLDIYGVDGEGASRWAGQVVPFAELLAVADGDRLEATGRIERLSHGPAGIQITLNLDVTALRTETIHLFGTSYRAERLVGAAAATLVLTETVRRAAPTQPVPTTRANAAPGPASGRDWIDVPVTRARPGAAHDQASHVHLPLPAPAHAVTALQITDEGNVEAMVKTNPGHLLIRGQIGKHRTGASAAATAYPIMQGDRWQLRIIITQEGSGHKTS